MADAILTSWRLDPELIAALTAVTWLYIRGWLRMRAQFPARYTPERLTSFLAGIVALFVALASPLDAFGNLLLEAHMVQHLLLIAVSPPLLLTGQPVVPLMRGLPAKVFKDAFGPFLAWEGCGAWAMRSRTRSFAGAP